MDRDGTVIRDLHYASNPAEVELLPSAGPVLAELREAGYRLVIVSNQSGIGRGLLSWSDVLAVHRQMENLLRPFGAEIDDARYCPHRPEDGCECRKPSPSMVLDSAAELGLDLNESFFVGDKGSDIDTGRRAGCRTIFLGEASSAIVEPDFAASSWKDVLNVVIQDER